MWSLKLTFRHEIYDYHQSEKEQSFNYAERLLNRQQFVDF